MIFDRLENAASYYGTHARLTQGLKFLKDTDLSQHAPGRYEIDGADLFFLVQAYDTKPRDKGFWEAHRQYLDIQYVARGVELMGFAPLTYVQPGEYDAARDFVPAQGEGIFIEMRAGTFTVFAPQDAHMPGLALGAPQPVRKIVVKVKI